MKFDFDLDDHLLPDAETLDAYLGQPMAEENYLQAESENDWEEELEVLEDWRGSALTRVDQFFSR